MEFLPASLRLLNAFPTLTEAIFFSTNIYFGLKYVFLFLLLVILCESMTLSFSLAVIAMTAFHSYARSMVGFYLREDFALPLILLSILVFVYAHREKRRWLFPLAAILVVLALNAWHFSSFLYLPALFVACWVYCKAPLLYHEKWLTAVAGILLAGCLLLPMSLHNRLYCSPFVIALISFILMWRFSFFRSMLLRYRIIFLPGLFCFSILLGGYMMQEHGGHVFQITWEKMLQSGVRPDDPSKISFLTRLYWDGDFSPPTGGEWLYDFRFFALFCILVTGVAYAFRRRLEKPALTLIWILAIAVFLSLIARRNLMISVIIVAIGASLYLKSYWTMLTPKLRIAISILALTSQLFMPWGRPTVTMGRTRDGHVDQLVNWFRHQKELQPVVAGHFPELPAILAFTNARIVTHSKFENRLVREKAEDFYRVMYGPPQELPRYMLNQGADFILVNLDFFSERRLFQGGVKTADGSALMHLAQVIQGNKVDPHFGIALNMLPQAEYVLLHFFPKGKEKNKP
jgi:hypothetical protein